MVENELLLEVHCVERILFNINPDLFITLVDVVNITKMHQAINQSVQVKYFQLKGS